MEQRRKISKASFVASGEQSLLNPQHVVRSSSIVFDVAATDGGTVGAARSLRRISGGALIPTAAAEDAPLTASSSKEPAVVFPTLELAQRSASLRRTASVMRASVSFRNKSLADTQSSVDSGTSSPTASLSRKHSLAASAHRSHLEYQTLLAFDDASRKTFALKTVAVAIIMLVRMQLAVERRRRVHRTTASREGDGGVDDDGTLSASTSIPTTARGLSSLSPRHIGSERSPSHQQLNKTAKRIAPGAASAEASSSVFVLATPPSALASVHPAAAPIVSSEPLPVLPSLSDGDTNGEHSSDDASNAEDEISVKSFDSNDVIDEDDASDTSESSEDVAHHGNVASQRQGRLSMAPAKKKKKAAFFPAPQDVAQMPILMQKHIERRALRVLQRFWTCFRFKRWYKSLKARRLPLTAAALPAAAVEGSDIFRGWSSAMLDAAFSRSAYVQVINGGTYIAYPGEPPRFVYFLLSGALAEVRPAARRPHGKPKGCGVAQGTADIVAQHVVPVILRASAALVEEPIDSSVGLYAVTNCHVALVPVLDVERAFRAVDENSSLRQQLAARYKNIREDRTATFLQSRYAQLGRDMQQASTAATAAAAALVLSAAPSPQSAVPSIPAVKAGSPGARGDASPPEASPRPGAKEAVPTSSHHLVLSLKSSSLLHNLTVEQERLLLPKLQPLSYFEGDNILAKDSDDFRNLYFILRGSVVAISRYREGADPHSRRMSRRRSSAVVSPSRDRTGSRAADAVAGTWKDLVFATWTAGQSIGDKAMYFQEPHVFTLRAETNCDLAVLKRSVLMQLLESGDRCGLKQAIALGAFAVRANDPIVRLRLNSVRSIPCIDAAIKTGVVAESFARELHALFTIRVFPAKELIVSSSGMVKCILILSTGHAVVDPNGPAPSLLPHGTPIGGTVLNDMRWKYPILATTECEGWVLPLPTFVAFCKRYNVLAAVKRLSAEQHEIRLRTDGANVHVYETKTPQSVVDVELASSGDMDAQRRLRSRMQLPSRHLLEQRSFQLKLPPDVPLPPAPAVSMPRLSKVVRSDVESSTRSETPPACVTLSKGSPSSRGGGEFFGSSMELSSLNVSVDPTSVLPSPVHSSRRRSIPTLHVGGTFAGPEIGSSRSPKPSARSSRNESGLSARTHCDGSLTTSADPTTTALLAAHHRGHRHHPADGGHVPPSCTEIPIVIPSSAPVLPLTVSQEDLIMMPEAPAHPVNTVATLPAQFTAPPCASRRRRAIFHRLENLVQQHQQLRPTASSMSNHSPLAAFETLCESHDIATGLRESMTDSSVLMDQEDEARHLPPAGGVLTSPTPQQSCSRGGLESRRSSPNVALRTYSPSGFYRRRRHQASLMRCAADDAIGETIEASPDCQAPLHAVHRAAASSSPTLKRPHSSCASLAACGRPPLSRGADSSLPRPATSSGMASLVPGSHNRNLHRIGTKAWCLRSPVVVQSLMSAAATE